MDRNASDSEQKPNEKKSRINENLFGFLLLFILSR